MARPLIELKHLSKCYNLGLPSEAEVLHGLDLRNPPSFDTELSQASLGAAYTLYDFGARSSRVRTTGRRRGRFAFLMPSSQGSFIPSTSL